jgi:hypothetical protein
LSDSLAVPRYTGSVTSNAFPECHAVPPEGTACPKSGIEPIADHRSTISRRGRAAGYLDTARTVRRHRGGFVTARRKLARHRHHLTLVGPYNGACAPTLAEARVRRTRWRWRAFHHTPGGGQPHATA